MCGLAGIVSARDAQAVPARLERMIRIQAHRGPDDEGRWAGQVGESHVALGNVRLAIRDLTPAGHQPMLSESGRQVLIYNGELYNCEELRAELEGFGVRFRSRCDTEVVLEAIRHWGPGAFARFNGMWALAWLDQDAGTLLLARDPLGIKPLYWCSVDGSILFASEIKGILAGSERRFPIDPTVVGRYLLQSLLDAQVETFFSGIEAFPPGHYVCFDLTEPRTVLPGPCRYWTVPNRSSLSANGKPSQVHLRETFFDAVRRQLHSDVPVGVLLSGGVDSSSIAAAMKLILGNGADLHLLSMVSEDPRYSETAFIERMAGQLGSPTHIVPLRCDPRDAFQLLDTVIWFNDEPVGSFSNVAQYLLMQEAQALGVTVILSGQGADELLCGYLKYVGFHVQALLREGRVPAALQTLSEFALRGTVLPQVRLHDAKRYLPGMLRPAEIDIRGPRLRENGALLPLSLGRSGVVDRQSADLCRLSLPALLHYEDRMSMASSRETRVPFLDNGMVQGLLALDPQWKLRDGWSKWLFRRAMEPHLPAEIAWRKDKQGFVNPEGEWLKWQLRGCVETMLKGDMLTAAAGLVDQQALQRRYAAYCRQAPDRGMISCRDIFNPIALELWARRFEPYLQFDA